MSLLDKSIGSMLSAIELYNKTDFKYSEETISILSVNSWELLLNALLPKISPHNPQYLTKKTKRLSKDFGVCREIQRGWWGDIKIHAI